MKNVKCINFDDSNSTNKFSMYIKSDDNAEIVFVGFFSVAQSVLLKENHMLNGVRLVVKETVQRRGVTQSKVYEDKVFVTGKIIEMKDTTQNSYSAQLH